MRSQLNQPLTLVHLLRRRAEAQPLDTAYQFLADGAPADSSQTAVKITYAELDRQARCVAANLRADHPNAQCALLLFPTSPEYLVAFWGCLYAGVIAIPAYPPRFRRYDSRIQSIIADSQPDLILARSNTVRRFADWAGAEALSDHANITAITYPMPHAAEFDWHEPSIERDSTAYIQYTSGSTRAPRGVVLTHDNLLHNLGQIATALNLDSITAGVSWLPLYHDMGLVGNALSAVFVGKPLVLMSPTAFAQQPMRWLRAISDSRASISVAPCSAYQLCIDHCVDADLADLDLRSWDRAIVGAEPVRAKVLERFARTFAPYGFRPEAFRVGYGLAEATLIVSIGRPTTMETLRRHEPQDRDTSSAAMPRGDAIPQPIGCGNVLSGHNVAIVNPVTLQLCPPGEEGEIWIASPSVAKGYWRQPEATQVTFGARLAESGDGPFLRTGDLGRIYDDTLVVTGRIKDLIIVHGVNFYPQDIEYVAQHSHPALPADSGAAFSVDETGQEQLYLVHEVKREYRAKDLDEVVRAIRRAIAEDFGLAVHTVVLLKPGQLPRTSSGKVQRSECRRLVALGDIDFLIQDTRGPEDASAKRTAGAAPIEVSDASTTALVYKICVEVLQQEVGIHDDLLTFGVDSISAARIIARIQEQLQLALPVAVLLQASTIAELATIIDTQRGGGVEKLSLPLTMVDRRSQLLLSYAQERMWFLHRIDPDGSAYNMSGALRLHGSVDPVAIQHCIDALVQRHETLRTTIHMTDGRLYAVIAPTMETPVKTIDLADHREVHLGDDLQAILSRMASEPFDLSHDSPLRVSLLRLSDCEHVVQLAIHHIHADAWSFGIIARELAAFYNGCLRDEEVGLPHLRVQYADYAVWQRRRLETGLLADQLAYWRRQLAGVSSLDLPTDRPRPAILSHRGYLVKASVPAALFDQLRALSSQHGVTLFMTVLAAFQTLLYRYTGQTDIPIAVPVAGRDHSATEDIVGVFVNTLILRGELSGLSTFADVLQRTRRVVLDAFANQDIPYAKVVAELQPERDSSRAPLAQVMVSVVNVPLEPVELDGIEATPVVVDRHGAQFDLTLTVVDTRLERSLMVEYSADLFDGATIERMIGHFFTLLQAIVGDTQQPIDHLPLLTQTELEELQVAGSGPHLEHAREKCVHHMIADQAVQTPDAVAVVGRSLRLDAEERISYRELCQRANRLARHLCQAGVGAGAFVGIAVERTTEMVVGLLGILAAGGAYVPLDPAFPSQRLEYMLRDSQARVLLTQESLRTTLPQHEVQAICLDSDWEAIAQHSADALEGEALLSDPAYLIYTSGSTGHPKGVQIPHSALTNFLHAMRHEPGMTADDVLLAVTTLSFDIAALEIYLPLVCGGQAVVVDRQVATDGLLLSEAIAAYGASMMQATPATWRMLIDAGWRGQAGLKMLCGGEALPRSLADELLERGGALWNMYGPTETTIWSSTYPVERGAGPIHLGYPIANTQFYVLDSSLQLVPAGVAGELYIGGDGVAAGYHRRPDLTAERFLPHPLLAHARIYRTGDVVRRRRDHTLEFLGRIDHQVKVRGFRIELGEIEQGLAGHPGIDNAAVVVRRTPDGENQLAAFYTRLNGHSPTQQELRSYLEDRLPSYMVPAHFQTVDAFPLTPNGKLDRKALASCVPVAPTSSVAYVAPQDDVEKVLAKIWEDLFKKTPISAKDNFFDLGGDSLLAVRMASRAYAALGRRFSVISLFRFPTIAQLANALRNEPTPLMSPTVVPLNRSGTQPPFFCVHGFGGEVLGYKEFVEHLGLNQPVFGLRARGMEGEAAPHADIEEMASFYIEAMRGLQPRGPYYLGGYCYGGVVAYEMARQLTERGEEIGMLAIFEGYAPNPAESAAMRLGPRAIANTLRNVPLWFRDYGVDELFRVGVAFRRKAPGLWENGLRNWDAWLRDVRMSAILDDATELPDYRIRLIASHVHAVKHYRPHPYQGRAVLFRVRAMSLSRAYDPAFGWGALARGGVDVHVLPGAHYNILEYPYVAASAAALKRALATARKI